MDINEISYKNLRKIQQLEKTSPVLTKVDTAFYQKVREYLKNLEKNVDKEKNEQKVNLYKEEIQNTKKIVNNIYELREKKIVQAALSTVRGGKPDLKNLHKTETKLYEILIKQIITSRNEILHEKIESTQETSVKPNKSEKAEKTRDDRDIVRVLEDIPEFVGTDMKTYSLRKEDVLTLSKEMSQPLQKRGVVKQIK